jgi:hypothetical protein
VHLEPVAARKAGGQNDNDSRQRPQAARSRRRRRMRMIRNGSWLRSGPGRRLRHPGRGRRWQWAPHRFHPDRFEGNSSSRGDAGLGRCSHVRALVVPDGRRVGNSRWTQSLLLARVGIDPVGRRRRVHQFGPEAVDMRRFHNRRRGRGGLGCDCRFGAHPRAERSETAGAELTVRNGRAADAAVPGSIPRRFGNCR